jgi:transposase-like protein
MNTSQPNPYKRHRFPAEIISHCVWMYFRFCLSYRDVEELMAERGVSLTYEAVRYWCRKFGQIYANQLRRRRPRPGDKWHLDEVFLTIHGERHYLWRAVDQDGHVLDILVQSRRNKKAAKRFFRKLLKGLTYVPRVVITDKPKSYGAAMHELLPHVEHGSLAPPMRSFTRRRNLGVYKAVNGLIFLFSRRFCPGRHCEIDFRTRCFHMGLELIVNFRSAGARDPIAPGEDTNDKRAMMPEQSPMDADIEHVATLIVELLIPLQDRYQRTYPCRITLEKAGHRMRQRALALQLPPD